MNELPVATFIIICVFGMAVPGPEVVLAVTNGSRYGIRRAFVSFAGVVLSDVLMISVLAVGFGALLAASPYCLIAVRLVGATYLLVVGFNAFRASFTAKTTDTEVNAPGHVEAHTRRAVITRSFVVAATNPEAWLFFSATIPTFINASQPIALQYAVLASIVAVADVSVLLIYAVLGAKAASLLRGPHAMWIDRLYGISLLGLSGMLLLQIAL